MSSYSSLRTLCSFLCALCVKSFFSHKIKQTQPRQPVFIQQTFLQILLFHHGQLRCLHFAPISRQLRIHLAPGLPGPIAPALPAASSHRKGNSPHCQAVQPPPAAIRQPSPPHSSTIQYFFPDKPAHLLEKTSLSPAGFHSKAAPQRPPPGFLPPPPAPHPCNTPNSSTASQLRGVTSDNSQTPGRSPSAPPPAAPQPSARS